jgi:hypothetical protein
VALKYDWSAGALGFYEESITASRLTAEIEGAFPALEALSYPAKRDAAISEVLLCFDLGATKYQWAGLGQREDQITAGRLTSEIHTAMPELDHLSYPARRDAALTELVSCAHVDCGQVQPWAGLGPRESPIAEGRLTADLRRTIAGLGLANLSYPNARDAALAELIAASLPCEAGMTPWLEYRMHPEIGAYNDGDPITSIFAIARGSIPVALNAAAVMPYLQGNSPDPLLLRKVDGRNCFEVATSLDNHHTSPVFRPSGLARYAHDFFSVFGTTTGSIDETGVPKPLSCSMSAWFRKKSSGDSSSARFTFGFMDNTVVYSSLPVARVGLIGNGSGGYRYGSLNCPDGVNGAANGDSDIDSGGDGHFDPADLVTPQTKWWHTRVKLIPATPSQAAQIGIYHNGTLVKTITNPLNFPRGSQGSSLANFTRIEATLRSWDLTPGLYLFDWRVRLDETLSL